jgi:hypothetical protein
MGVNENIGSAASLASTGLIIIGASVPLRLLKGMNKGKKYSGYKRKRGYRKRRRRY